MQEVPHCRAVDRLITAASADPVPGRPLTEVTWARCSDGNTSSPRQIEDTLDSMGVRPELLTGVALVRAAELAQPSREHPAIHPLTGTAMTLWVADTLVLSVVERLAIPVVTNDRYWHPFMTAGHTSRVLQLGPPSLVGVVCASP